MRLPWAMGWAQATPIRRGSIYRRFAIAPLKARAIAFGDTVAFLSSVIPAEAGIQRPKTRQSPLDSRLRGNDSLVDRDNSVPHRRCPKMCAARDHRSISS